MTEWIGVKERLPEDDGVVLVYAHRCRRLAFFAFNTEWRSVYTNDRIDGVTHWAPLLDPPTVDEANP
jgi:hypothetical protein